jgi:hypothetical protein
MRRRQGLECRGMRPGAGGQSRGVLPELSGEIRERSLRAARPAGFACAQLANAHRLTSARRVLRAGLTVRHDLGAARGRPKSLGLVGDRRRRGHENKLSGDGQDLRRIGGSSSWGLAVPGASMSPKAAAGGCTSPRSSSDPSGFVNEVNFARNRPCQESGSGKRVRKAAI